MSNKLYTEKECHEDNLGGGPAGRHTLRLTYGDKTGVRTFVKQQKQKKFDL
jgi:hypothetical protein